MSGFISKLLGRSDPVKSMNEAGIKLLLKYGLNGNRIEEMPSTAEDLILTAGGDRGLIPYTNPKGDGENHAKLVAYLKQQSLIQAMRNIKTNCTDTDRATKIGDSIKALENTFLLSDVKMMHSRSFKDMNGAEIVSMQVPVLMDYGSGYHLPTGSDGEMPNRIKKVN